MRTKAIALLMIIFILNIMTCVEAKGNIPEIDKQQKERIERRERVRIKKSADYKAICKLVQAEAGNQCYKGKVAVACVVLNRVDSDRFPNSVNAVISQKGQFAVYPTAYNKAIPDKVTKKAVLAAMMRRKYKDILFFTAGGYNRYCTPAYKIQDHYFGY